MLPEELIRKVRLIELTTRKAVDDLMSGQYRSHFKGAGVQFSEHRQYVAGDDIRHIDWKVSARVREVLVKKFEEERELTMLLVVDVSGSERFGSARKLKSEIAAELSGMLAYAAVHTGDRVGVLFFGGQVETIIPPRKGRSHILRIIRDVLTYRTRTRGTDLKGALEAAGRIMKHSGVIFVISDFLPPGEAPASATPSSPASDAYGVSLKRLAKRHDVVALWIQDEREVVMPSIGQVLVNNPETGEDRLIDTGSYAFKTWLKDFRARQDKTTEEAFKGGRVDLVKVKTNEDHGDVLVKYFRTRRSKRGRR